jgi:WD40 repeat protein
MLQGPSTKRRRPPARTWGSLLTDGAPSYVFRGLCTALLSLSVVVDASAQGAFERDVEPIFAKKCAGCHYPAAGKLKGGLDLSTAALTAAGGETGAAVISGDADNSLLVQMIEHRVEPFMPPPAKFAKLSDSEISVIRAWIDSGAKGTAPAPATAPGPTPSPSLTPAPVSAIAYAPNGALIARGGMRQVELFGISADTPGATLQGVLDGHAESVRALAFSPDGAILAAAGGQPGRNGEVKLWNVADRSLQQTLSGHKDNILGIAFSADGKQLVTGSYDKTATVWDIATGAALHVLADHVDAVNAVAFSPDGKTIATGAGDRTVKLWDAATGERQITLSDSTDAVLSIAISPDGRYLAAGAADKRIRVWDLDASGKSFVQTGLTSGVLRHSTFAHQGAVLQVRYAPDGAVLYSSGEDKRIKSWDAATMTEKLLFEAQPDWVLTFAIAPDGKTLAAGRYDASSAILDTATGKALFTAGPREAFAKAVPPDDSGRKKVTNVNVDLIEVTASIPPTLQSFKPARFARGGEFEATVSGTNLEGAEPYFDDTKIQVALVSSEALPRPEVKRDPDSLGVQIFDNAVPYTLKLKVTVPADAAPGQKNLFCKTPNGLSEPTSFVVLPGADAREAEPNNSTAEAQLVQWPTVVAGAMNSESDVDRYKLHVPAGKELVCILKDLAPNFLLTLLDPDGNQLTSSDAFGAETEARLGYRFEQEGDYFLNVSHKDFRKDLGYRLHVGEFPWVYAIAPLGVPAGPPQRVAVKGFNIGGAESMEVDPPDDAVPWHVMGLPLPAYADNPVPSVTLAVAPYPAVDEQEPNNDVASAQPIAPMQVANGVLQAENGADQDLYRVELKKNQRVFLDVFASRAGSPVDSVVDVLDTSGKLVQRAKARCVGQTFVTLSDRDSFSGGIRIDNWSDMAVNDFLMAGNEIMQVSRLPGYADEDISLKNYRGKRQAYFGTTPEFHAVNAPVYKVEIHGVDVELTPNGMPVFPIYWTNDDAVFDTERRGDSQLDFTAPADGAYILRVRDAAEAGGPEHQYRLMLRGMHPTFEFAVGPYRNNVCAGGSVPLDLRIVRRDGFDAPIKVSFEGLPPGISIADTIIAPEDEGAEVALNAAPRAQSTGDFDSFKVTAVALMGAGAITREARIGAITVVNKAPDLKVDTDRDALAIAPGETQTLQVTLDRDNGFTTRVPLEVLNLPFGVRVIDTGLNGILVRDGEYERAIKIYCEPWVKPMEERLYVQARIEARAPGRMLFLSRPVQLKVAAATQTAAAQN